MRSADFRLRSITPPLHLVGTSGVFKYDTSHGTPSFPVSTGGQSANYWVDVVFTTTPTAPANLTAAATSPTQVALSWTASAGTITAYHLERSTNGINFGEIAGNVSGTSYTDSTAQGNVTYTYRVCAENSGFFSGYSNTNQVTTPPALITAPSAPTALTAMATSSTSVSLSWAASTGTITAYHVERSINGVNFTEIAGNVQTTSYTDAPASAQHGLHLPGSRRECGVVLRLQ